MPGNFHTSAHDIELKHGHKLKCKLRNSSGNVVESSIDLDEIIGNSDGWFKWDSANFSKSARNISLKEGGKKLEADLPTADGGYRERQGIMLSDRIENRDGNLVFN
ncbi:Cyanovirin-N [Trichophaea hybrida]|nr:Cyanovirin-N [Trichophaea hybrida]